MRSQRRLLQLHEVVSAWSALEVFILAIAVAMLEIGLVSGFIVGKNCDGIQVARPPASSLLLLIVTTILRLRLRPCPRLRPRLRLRCKSALVQFMRPPQEYLGTLVTYALLDPVDATCFK